MSRLWIVIEPILLLLVVGFLLKAIVTPLGIGGSDLEAALFASAGPDWITAARLEFLSQTLKWSLLLACAALLCRGRGFAIHRPLVAGDDRLSVFEKVLLGLAVAIPLQLLATVPRWYHYHIKPLGQTPAIWDLLYSADWTPGFWLFMAAGSFVLIPIVEELYFRGYVFGGLLRRFSARQAVLISAVLFAAVHLQYLAADFYSMFNSATVLVSAAALAAVVYVSRSLMPAVVAHAYANVPHPLTWAPYEIVLLIPAALALIWLWPRMSNNWPAPGISGSV